MKNKFLVGLLLISTLISMSAYAEEWSRERVLSFDTRKVLGQLQKALAVQDEIPTLEKSRLLGRDQKSAESDLDELIQEAIGLLESDGINQLRSQYQRLEDRIATEKRRLTQLRRERVLAPSDGRSLSINIMPGETLKQWVASTRADYDLLIEATASNIESYEEEKTRTLDEMTAALAAIDVNLTSEQLDTMMSSVTGNDIMSMAVVFSAIKDLTVQLSVLTQESGEDLEHAKRYYGMVVVLHRLTGTMQKQFLTEVNGNYLPKLAEFRVTANDNLKEAQALMAAGANREMMRSNIEANEMTIRVVKLYEKLLNDQKDKVGKALQVTEKEIRVASNTYNTVSLSSAVVGMIREGANTFEQLISLQMPDVRQFQSEHMKEEFRRLTARMSP
ncbi:hypothetical protein BN1049_02750 [Pseudomonas saudimassiliensis]|uniref:Uncharacterized protein n=1 Tax=Pseudomonas saudimassiliensis TaxID=1461581 RepID=A0A078MJA1_9PSED|nr:hypothetical protein [Pseudomonas saudimassiliensis]CEA06365.1 hypothetical protein BN1049_02750 [Pseudomonas saudimassiliensis]CEF27790.1 hypothetical protein BN1049_02750 [Pseudomonas saudimassiliensis]